MEIFKLTTKEFPVRFQVERFRKVGSRQIDKDKFLVLQVYLDTVILIPITLFLLNSDSHFNSYSDSRCDSDFHCDSISYCISDSESHRDSDSGAMVILL